MIRAKKEGHSFVLREAVHQMQLRVVRLSEKVINFALKQVGE
ncbi:MAG: hypothetical protein AB7S75_01555 [Desulfococcaceae bacterium]